MTEQTVKIELSSTHARALHWVVRHMTFEEGLQGVPLHLGKPIRQERAYGIMHAAAALEAELVKAGQHGDGWMYGTE